MERILGRSFVLLFVTAFLLFHTASSLRAQESSNEHIFFHAKIFTGDPQNPYAEAVAIRGDKIIAVGNFPEVVKSVSASAERVDLDGKSLFPGFIDSHSHSIDGGLNLISADATEKVNSLNELPPFAENAKKTAKGMRGDILEILGLRSSSGPTLTSSMPTSAPALTRSKAFSCAAWMATLPGRIAPCCSAPASRQIFCRRFPCKSAVTTAWIKPASPMVF
jgi:hypothetical protein